MKLFYWLTVNIIALIPFAVHCQADNANPFVGFGLTGLAILLPLLRLLGQVISELEPLQYGKVDHFVGHF